MTLISRRPGTGWAIYDYSSPRAPLSSRSVAVELPEALPTDDLAYLRIRLGHGSRWSGANLGRFRLSASGPRPGEGYRRKPLEAPPPSVDFAGESAGQEWSANALAMSFRWCPPGNFVMGSPKSETDRSADEDQVPVALSGYWLGRCEVTQRQWLAVMGTRPWSGKADVREGDAYPATYLSAADAEKFCEELTRRERLAGRLPAGWEFHLPSEAQWEYACRAGAATRFGFGDDPSKLGEVAWFSANALLGGEPYAHEVGKKSPNAWGLHDMHGNVWEWTRDWLQPRLPGGNDPVVLATGDTRVVRGGSWNYRPEYGRAAYRGKYPATHWANDTGFRVALVRVNSGGGQGAILGTEVAKTLVSLAAQQQVDAGLALARQGRFEEAIAAYRQASELEPKYILPHFYAGHAWLSLDKPQEAEASFQNIVELDGEDAEAHYYLGIVRLRAGRFPEALAAMKRGHALGSRQANWRFASGYWLGVIERMMALDEKLGKVMRGEAQPQDVTEHVALAELCQRYKRWHAAAAGFYRQAFAADSKLLEKSSYRYDAACSAALAGTGQGEDATGLGDKQRAALRQAALDWLRAELTVRRKALDALPAAERPSAVQRLLHWQGDRNLAGVRDSDKLQRLPTEEQAGWRQLWKDVADALRPPPKAQPN
jgi:formylglycine-generating enzyme required for sulfatase activity